MPEEGTKSAKSSSLFAAAEEGADLGFEQERQWANGSRDFDLEKGENDESAPASDFNFTEEDAIFGVWGSPLSSVQLASS